MLRNVCYRVGGPDTRKEKHTCEYSSFLNHEYHPTHASTCSARRRVGVVLRVRASAARQERRDESERHTHIRRTYIIRWRERQKTSFSHTCCCNLEARDMMASPFNNLADVIQQGGHALGILLLRACSPWPEVLPGGLPSRENRMRLDLQQRR